MDLGALVFDFDGLILDTETSIYEAWSAAFSAHGAGELTIEEWAAEIGTQRGLDLETMLHSRASGPVDLAAMHAVRQRYRDELLQNEITRPGVEAWIEEAERAAVPVAIASSSEYEWVDGHLRRLGLRDRFGVLSCFDGTCPAKPAPDLYLNACASLGIEPARALAVEDSPNGVRAAKAAGMKVVAVPNPITAQLDLSEADVQLASLAECSIRDALARTS
jgi:HAD superfamily hydrolase (TIGR01509 family)